MSSVTPHTEGGSLCLITVGLDPEATETAKRAAMQESVKFISAFPDYPQNLLPAQLEQQLEGAEALVCLIDFDKNKDLAVQAATNLQPLLNGRTALIALSGDENPGLILQCHAGRLQRVSHQTFAGRSTVELPAKIAGALAVVSASPAPSRGPGAGLSRRKRRGGKHDRSGPPGDVPGPAARAEGAHPGLASPPRTRGPAAGHGLAPLQLPRAAAQCRAARPYAC